MCDYEPLNSITLIPVAATSCKISQTLNPTRIPPEYDMVRHAMQCACAGLRHSKGSDTGASISTNECSFGFLGIAALCYTLLCCTILYYTTLNYTILNPPSPYSKYYRPCITTKNALSRNHVPTGKALGL